MERNTGEGRTREEIQKESYARMEEIVVLASLGKTTADVAAKLGMKQSYAVRTINNMIDRKIPIGKKHQSKSAAILYLTGDLEDAIIAVRNIAATKDAVYAKELTPGQQKRTGEISQEPKFQPWWGIITRSEPIMIR